MILGSYPELCNILSIGPAKNGSDSPGLWQEENLFLSFSGLVPKSLMLPAARCAYEKKFSCLSSQPLKNKFSVVSGVTGKPSWLLGWVRGLWPHSPQLWCTQTIFLQEAKQYTNSKAFSSISQKIYILGFMQTNTVNCDLLRVFCNLNCWVLCKLINFKNFIYF